MVLKKSVRIVKKVNEGGKWKFVSLKRVDGRYQWDQRPGQYFLDRWEGDKRRREFAGATPSQALTAQKRKRMEVVGALALNGAATHSATASAQSPEQPRDEDPQRVSMEEARQTFLSHVATHSPDKPETHRRYAQVMRHFERLVGYRQCVEAITRADLD